MVKRSQKLVVQSESKSKVSKPNSHLNKNEKPCNFTLTINLILTQKL